MLLIELRTYEVCLKNTETKIRTETFLILSVILLYQNKQEIISSTLIYDWIHCLKPVINSARFKLDVWYKIVVS